MAPSDPPPSPNLPLVSQSPEDEYEVQMAIEGSLKDAVDFLPLPSNMNAKLPESQKSSRLTIDDMVNALAQRRGTELPLIQDPDGDTWIFIDAAPKQPEQDQLGYENYRARHSKPYLMKKETLLKLNSSVIREKLGPTEQFRVLRRRQLINKLPSNVKYVLDLTPPTEGDEAVWYMSSLCCCEGVRLWYLSTVLWRVAPQMVGGEEEYSSAHMPITANIKKAFEAQGVPKVRGKGNNMAQDETFMAPEYTPIRHRMAIERVLLAAQGLDPLLDSAPKLWATFAASRYLEIVDSPLTDYLVRWLRATPNSNFLDVLPEIAFIMADYLRVHDLTRDSFAILVGEEALDSISRSRDPKVSHKISVFGRKKEDLPEALQTRVEYAAKKFSERIMAEFTALAGDQMDWVEGLSQMCWLSEMTRSDLHEPISDLKAILKKYVCTVINAVLCANFTYLPSPNIPAHGGEKLVPRVNRADVWRSLSAEERIFTRSFWLCLRSSDLFSGKSSLDLEGLCYDRVNGRSNRWGLKLPEVPWTKCMVDMPKHIIYKHIQDYHREQHRISIQQVQASELLHPQASQTMIPSTDSGNEQSSSSATQPDVAQYIHSQALPIRTAGPRIPLAHEIQADERTSPLFPQASEKLQTVEEESRPQLPGATQTQFELYGNLNYFDLKLFFHQAQEYIGGIADKMLAYTDAQVRGDPHQVDLINSLVCLNDDDFKYLPLWAGGNDDGSNGVFNDDVPISESGFTTAGPGVHTGSSSHTPSDFEMMSAGSESNFNTSTATNAGYSNHLHHSRVYATDSVDGSSTVDDSATSDSYEMIDYEADNNSTHQAADMDVDGAGALTHTGVSTKDDDEDYGDLFLEDDDGDSDAAIGCGEDDE